MNRDLEPYPEYKDSIDRWLGEVPEHWSEVPIKHVSRVDNSGAYGDEPEANKFTLPVATTAQIDSDGRFHVDRMPLRSFDEKDVARYGCKPNDILIVKSSGSAENIISGKAGFVDADTPEFVFSNFLMRLVPDPKQVDPAFLYALIVSSVTRERVRRMVSTTTYPNLQVGEYVNSLAPLPPLEEQKQIAAFLDHETAKIDALIEKQQQLIALLGEKRQAVISHAVTKGLNPDAPMRHSGVEWIGEVPAHWNMKRLKFLVTESSAGPYGSSLTKSMYTTHGYRVYGQEQASTNDFTVGDYYISETKFQSMAKYETFANDVLVCVMGYGNVGKVAVVPSGIERGIINPRLVRYKTNQHVEPNFLRHSMMSEAGQAPLQESAQGSTMPGLNMKLIGELKVAIPPLAEQAAISLHVDQTSARFESLISTIENQKTTLQERRTALISAAVTGKIDVRGWQPSAAAANNESDMGAA